MSIVFKDFGTAYLAAPLAVGGLTITVDNPAALPVLTNGDYFYLVLQKYGDRSYVEIVKVTATAGSIYTIQRGQAGTAARAFALGDYAELRLTVGGLSEFIAQGIGTKMDKSGGGDFSGIYRFLNPNTSRLDIVRTSDDATASVALDFSASDGHRAIFGGPSGANVVTSSLLLRPNGYGNGVGQVKIDKDGVVDVVACVMRGAQRTEAGAAVRYDELAKYTPTTRSINGHGLSSDFDITADEVFKVGATVRANARFEAADFQYRDPAGAYGMRLSVVGTAVRLQAGKTDNTLADQQLFLSGWAGNPLSSFKVYSDAPLVRRKGGVDHNLFDQDNKPSVGDVSGLATVLSGKYGSDNEPAFALGHAFGLLPKIYPAGADDLLRFQTVDTIARNISIPDNETFQITRVGTGIFKVSIELVLEDYSARQMPQVVAMLIRSGTIFLSKRILLGYTAAAAGGFQNICGSCFFANVQVGDKIRFGLSATNNAAVSLYGAGSATVQEV